MSNTSHHRLIIVGSGPAGYTAAIYAARAGLDPVMITGLTVGGQLTTTTHIDNWPGDADELSGPDLMERMKAHAERFGVGMVVDYIQNSDLTKRPFTLFGENGNYTCDALIIATGASAKYLGLDSEQQFLNKGVSACATCDGFFYKNQHVAVVGGGNTALEEALYLSNIAKSVTLIHRRQSFRAEKMLQDKFLQKVQTGHINVLYDTQVLQVLGDDSGVTGVLVENVQNKQTKTLDVFGLFIAIGHTPNSAPFLLDNEDGYITTGQNTAHGITATNIDGVFACGDVADNTYRQAIASAGAGCKAALDAERFLSLHLGL